MLCIGTATQDVFLVGGKIFKPVCDEQGNCFEHLPLGAKLDVERVVFSTGGNAMNAAVTFARQHLESHFMGAIGTDPAAAFVLEAFDREGIDTRGIVQDECFETGYSTLLLAPTGERTALRHHAKVLRDNGSPLDLTAIQHADWVYLSSLGSVPLLEKIITIAAKHNVQVVFNPGTAELKQAAKLKSLLDDIAILSVNKEEAALLFEGKTLEELVRHAAQVVPTVVISDGPRGAMATDGKTLVESGMYEDVKVVDRLGAGDAFTSGFVAQLARGKSLEEAVVFASANSTSVVQQIGATAGVLHHGAQLHDMPLKVRNL